MAKNVSDKPFVWTMHEEEKLAAYRLWQREQSRSIFSPNYPTFRRSIKYASTVGCWMVQVRGIWIGIERDGYTHS